MDVPRTTVSAVTAALFATGLLLGATLPVGATTPSPHAQGPSTQGPSTQSRTTAIDREYRALQGQGHEDGDRGTDRDGSGNPAAGTEDAHAWLGNPVTDETCGLRDHGCYRQYEKGAIHWSPATGAHAQRGAILAAWRHEGSEHGALGYPVGRETCSGDSCEVRYQRGRITWSHAHGAAVHRDADTAGSISVVVNKKHPLAPRDYSPEPLREVGGGVLLRDDAAAAYQRMSRAAAAQGVALTPVSGYRDHDTQAGLYEQYTRSYGSATADALSARPGYSEHQTGLALDVGAPEGTCSLLACFADTPQGRWVAAHGHEHGFLVRYPEGRTATTGYAYEPWHLRYVGTATAGSMHRGGAKDVESYLGMPAAPRY